MLELTNPIAAETTADSQLVGSTDYPIEFASAVAGRSKTKLGDLFGLTNFGVNHTKLEPGSSSALMHYHRTQDEMVYILEGEATLYRLHKDPSSPTTTYRKEKTIMKTGDCIGFPFGVAVAHCMCNDSNQPVRFLEIGDRSRNDQVEYPEADLKAVMGEDCKWIFTHKDGTPY
eukprot:CAMPEP_0198144616 /NCGR_PEP_ID=MMETSP1443-20131203/17015_1 /TAXON_ID=186043 /ORGANISM="Entomoneis sp., Strain CCMP2396" /LENGTH=172 /DNA_ID=CAMNT_0043808041 /DNA_START=206 /DNA_END=724 /DNA_ORIENTATION=-